jgi:predicted DNA-binding transcriptional regulator AlpA
LYDAGKSLSLSFDTKHYRKSGNNMERFFMQQSISINPALRDFSQLPSDALVRLPVVKGLLGISGATVWRMVKAGKLKTYKLTERTTTFSVRELRDLLADKKGV